MAAGRKGVRQQRTILGGRVTEGPPVLTYGVMVLCLLLYALRLTVPAVGAQLDYAPADTTSEPWRMLTSAFLHSSALPHVLLNMYGFYLVGPYLENLLGRWRFAALYLLSAIAGSIGFLMFASPMSTQAVVGASGAVFGLFGAFIVVQGKLGRDGTLVLVVLGVSVVMGFLVPSIAWQSHLGGFVAGALLGVAFAWAPRSRRTLYGVTAVAATSLLLLILVVVTIHAPVVTQS